MTLADFKATVKSHGLCLDDMPQKLIHEPETYLTPLRPITVCRIIQDIVKQKQRKEKP